MKGKIFYSLLGGLVVAGCVAGADSLLAAWAPKGQARDFLERSLTAPGRVLHDKLEDNEQFRRWRKKSRRTVAAEREKIEQAAESLGLLRLYNAGAWSAAGFLLCLLMTVFFSVSSFGSAVSLGLKATLALLFLQAGLALTRGS